jgi:GGDEF domain-containing protein
MPEPPPGVRPPRPVADVPPAALADGEAAAKGWLLGMVAAGTLDAAAELPIAELAREGPALCAAALRAVGSEAALRRLEPGGELAPLAAHAGALVGAREPAASVAAVAALRRALWEALLAHLGPLDAAGTAALAERLAWVCDMVAAATLAGEPAIGVHDTRGGWRAAAARGVREGRSFALLAVEVDDAERLLAADGDGAAQRALGQSERAIRAALGPGDVLGREAGGRAWIVTREDGRALAGRLAQAVGAVELRAAALTVSIGLAAFPQDGADAEALAARADERLFAARASGVTLVP